MDVEYSCCIAEIKRLHLQVLDPHGNLHGAICVPEIKRLHSSTPVVVVQLRPLHEGTVEYCCTATWNRMSGDEHQQYTSPQLLYYGWPFKCGYK